MSGTPLGMIQGNGLQRRALAAVILIGAGVAASLALLPFGGAAGRSAGLVLYCLIATLVIDGLGDGHPFPQFGLGNGITLFRAGGTAVFAALAFEPWLLGGSAAWAALVATAVLLALDGLDGWAARWQRQTSEFGARFDMEVDAVLILVLSALALGLGKADAWVLILGLLRYAFVLAGRLIPALGRPLPPSTRRRAICALQVATLALLLAPPVLPPVSTALAATAFAALLWSFAVDVIWLLKPVR